MHDHRWPHRVLVAIAVTAALTAGCGSPGGGKTTLAPSASVGHEGHDHKEFDPRHPTDGPVQVSPTETVEIIRCEDSKGIYGACPPGSLFTTWTFSDPSDPAAVTSTTGP